MTASVPKTLGIIAGKGVYPRLLAQSAREQGVSRIVAVAFRGETHPSIERCVDRVEWIRLGQYQPFMDAFTRNDVHHAVMAGQITPSNLFNVRMDRATLALLKQLPVRNADTIFGAVCHELEKLDVEMLPAYLFMESAMPEPGPLAGAPLSEREQQDVDLGLEVAKTTSGLEIGQTVVIKEGTILAVEAFEGTDRAIMRAGKLGGKGNVVVKVAKQGHDMRFDIPVVGMRTLKSLKKAHTAVLALEAHRTILLERERVLAQAERQGLKVVAVEFERSTDERNQG